jgi:hypothetical protein
MLPLCSALAAPATLRHSSSLSVGRLGAPSCAASGRSEQTSRARLSLGRRCISTKRRRVKAMNKHKYEKMKKRLRRLTAKNVRK